MKKLTFVILLLVSAFNSFAQNQDANPYMGMWYADHSNYRMYGADVLTRTTRASAEARTNVIKGDHCYDTLAQEILLYNGSAWVALAESGGGTLDQSYDFGGSGSGREIVADAGAVKISGEDGLLVTGTFGSGTDSEWSGAGTGMFFNPKKAAFRAGYVDGTQWDNTNVGDYSTAFGTTNIASGEASFAGGDQTIASGYSSFSYGSGTTEASGDNSFAIGDGAIASGEFSVSFNGNASGGFSLATGAGTEASGLASTAMGSGATSKSYGETAIGLFNTDYTPTSTSTWSATDRLFVVGNGQNSGTKSDALIIQKNGNLTMPTTTGAFSPPVLTTTERNALTPTAGMIIYNSTTSRHEGYDGTNWNAFYLSIAPINLNIK